MNSPGGANVYSCILRNRYMDVLNDLYMLIGLDISVIDLVFALHVKSSVFVVFCLKFILKRFTHEETIQSTLNCSETIKLRFCHIV